MHLNAKLLICAIVLAIMIDRSSQYCSKFGRHLLQHQCVLTPESSEGPYYLPNHLIRKDITENKEGLPFKLKMTFTDVNTCEPLSNVSVDIWQCDASGEYSGYINAAPSSSLHTEPSDDKTFLRGIQMTDRDGKVEFNSIFPGWYSPRTTHIHISSHLGGKTIHTGQLYFSNKLVNRIARFYPYNKTQTKRQSNEDDFLFNRYKGVQSLVTNIKPMKGKRITNGLIGEIIIGLDPNEESKMALHGKG